MGVFRLIRRYQKKLEKRFTKQITRKQFNFPCDPEVRSRLKLLAVFLETPIYPVCEHALQLGMKEMAEMVLNETLKTSLQHHLVQDHLLVPVVNMESEPSSRRAARVRGIIRFLQFIEESAGNTVRDVRLDCRKCGRPDATYLASNNLLPPDHFF